MARRSWRRGGCELSVGFGVMFVAVLLPGGDFPDQFRLVGDAAIQTPGREDGEFGFGYVEPASAPGRVAPFEPLDEPAGFRGGEGFIERGGGVSAAIVLDPRVFFAALGKWTSDNSSSICAKSATPTLS